MDNRRYRELSEQLRETDLSPAAIVAIAEILSIVKQQSERIDLLERRIDNNDPENSHITLEA